MLIRKVIAFIVGLIIYITQKRLGMGIVAFLLLDLLFQEKRPIKVLSIFFIFAVASFFIGFILSFHITGLYYGLVGAKSFTFGYGFIGGIIESGIYLLLALLPFKFYLSHNLQISVRYALKMCIIFSLFGGLAQGTYLAGWQNLFYV